VGRNEAESVSRLGVARHHARLKLASFSQALGFQKPAQLAFEVLILFAVCVVAAAWAVHQLSQFEFTRLCRGFDYWFDSDPARTISNITSRWAMFHERSVLHPLYSLFIAAPFGLVGELFSLRTSTVTTLYVALQSTGYAGATYIALRAFGLGRLDALLGILLLYSTAASIYWIGFPEWIAYGAISVLICVIWVAGPSAIRNHATGVAQNLISGSIVVTSWTVGAMASLLSDWPKLRWARLYGHTRDALALMAALSVLQYLIFPTAGGFLNIWFEFKLSFIQTYPDAVKRSLLSLSRDFFGQTLLAPLPSVVSGPRVEPSWGVLLITGQQRGVELTPLSVVALGLWISLWVLGIRAAVGGGVRSTVVVFVLGTLAFFYVLHVAFGGEIFLFSLHFAPLMVFVALWGARSRFKMLTRILCIALTAASLGHNYPAFSAAVAAHNAADASWLDRNHPASVAVAKTDCR
jgi:hypothetical protein